MEQDVAGELMLYNNEDYFSTAKLRMGSGTSGKLVSEVKKQLKEYPNDILFSIVDDPPGIGCPAIASLNGADLVLIVTEPSLSGLIDMKRIIETARSFHMKMAVCINKFDISLYISRKIKDYCDESGIALSGRFHMTKM